MTYGIVKLGRFNISLSDGLVPDSIKLLPELILSCYQLDPLKHFSMKSWSKFKIFH